MRRIAFAVLLLVFLVPAAQGETPCDLSPWEQHYLAYIDRYRLFGAVPRLSLHDVILPMQDIKYDLLATPRGACSLSAMQGALYEDTARWMSLVERLMREYMEDGDLDDDLIGEAGDLMDRISMAYRILGGDWDALVERAIWLGGGEL